jgi:hypothetical protein
MEGRNIPLDLPPALVGDEEKNGIWASDPFGVLAQICTEEREGWGAATGGDAA